MCHGENPSELSTTLFLVFSSQPFIMTKGGWGSYFLEVKSMGNFELGRAPNPGMSCFSCMDKKTLEPYASLTYTFMFWGAARHSGSFTIFVLHSSGISCYVYPSRSTSVFPLERLWLMCCIVILNYRVYETLLLVFPSEIELWSLPMVVLLCTLVRVWSMHKT